MPRTIFSKSFPAATAPGSKDLVGKGSQSAQCRTFVPRGTRAVNPRISFNVLSVGDSGGRSLDAKSRPASWLPRGAYATSLKPSHRMRSTLDCTCFVMMSSRLMLSFLHAFRPHTRAPVVSHQLTRRRLEEEQYCGGFSAILRTALAVILVSSSSKPMIDAW